MGELAIHRDVETEARLLVFNPLVMLGGQLAFFAVLALIWLFFSPVVPPRAMTLWLSFAGSLASLVLLFDLAFFLRGPDNAELLRFWRAIDKKQTILFDAIAAAVIWVLLPYGGEAHRIVIAAFCVGYVPLQMISDPENAFGNKLSIVVVLGSFMAWLLLQQSLAMNVLAVMVALYGLVLFYSSDAFRRVVIATLKARRELELSNSRLEAAVEEVTLSRDARTRFIAAATHDLGQPIQAARLYGEAALTATTQERREKVLGQTVAALDSAQSMLGNMLYHMRLEADAVKPQLNRIELRPFLDKLVGQFDDAARDVGSQIMLRSGCHQLACDPVLLERAIGNLIVNALTHSGAGTVRVIACAAPDELKIAVSDNGQGIPPSEREAIFVDYSQGRNARSGFGLGLGSARRLIALMGGQLRLAERDRGACFVIQLPLLEGAQ